MKIYISNQDGCRQATEQEAAAAEEKNREIMSIEDPMKWLQAMKEATFIIAIGGTK